MCTLVVFNELAPVSMTVRDHEACNTYAAARPPTSSAILVGLWRLPLPAPLKLYRGAAAGRVISNKLDVWVLVEIRVCVELASNQVIDFLRVGGKHEGQAIYNGIDKAGRSNGGGAIDVVYARRCLGLPGYECEIEG